MVAVNGVPVIGATHAAVVRLLDTLCRDSYGHLTPDAVVNLSLRGYRAPLATMSNASSLENIDSIVGSPSRRGGAGSSSEESPVHYSKF